MQAIRAPSASCAQVAHPASRDAPAPTNGISVPRCEASRNACGMTGMGGISSLMDQFPPSWFAGCLLTCCPQVPLGQTRACASTRVLNGRFVSQAFDQLTEMGCRCVFLDRYPA